jgi:Replicase family
VLSDVLKRLREQIPLRPYCTDGPRGGVYSVYSRPREEALKLAYIQLSLPWRRHYLALEVDQENAELLPDQLGLPRPTIITVNPASSHADFLFELEYPVWTAGSKSSGNAKSEGLYRKVQRTLTITYRADPAYTGSLESALSSRWRALPEGFLETASELPARRARPIVLSKS